jgi:hypothetical protein
VVVGHVKKVDLGTSSFERIITGGCLYVDKSRFIEDFLNEAPSVQLIARQRRLGKSLNMDMLRCFLTDDEDMDAVAARARRQVVEARYGADTGKPVTAIGLAFRGKHCVAVG